MLWANLALSAVSADLRFSVRVRLLDVAGGVLNTSEPRGSGGDGAFVVGTQGCERFTLLIATPLGHHPTEGGCAGGD